MDEASVRNVINQLRELANTALQRGRQDQYFDFLDAAEAMDRWLASGMAGLCPVDLWKFGIRLPEAAPAVVPPEALPEVPEEEKPAVEAPPVETPECQEWLKRGQEALGAEDLPQAIDWFQRVVEHGEGKAKEDAQVQLEKARTQLTEEIDTYLDLAKEARKAGERRAEAEAYREVLRLAPDHSEARQHQTRLALEEDQAAQQEAVRRVKRLFTKLGRRFQDIEEGIRKAEELSSYGIEDSELRRLYEEAKKERARLLQEAGDVETMTGMGQLEGAIARYNEIIALGQREVWNEIANAFVPTEKMLSQTREEYKAFCRGKGQKYLQEANRSLPTYPGRAKAKLELALTGFGELPDEEQAALETRLSEVEEMLKEWKQADDLVKQAASQEKPEEKLKLLKAAKERYADYKWIDEGIDDKIRRAGQEVVLGAARDISHRCTEAQAKLDVGDFSEARTACLEARKLAPQVSQEVSELSDALKSVDDLLERIARAENIETAIKNREYATAVDLLKEVSKDEQSTPYFQTVQTRLVPYQREADTYRQANQAFEKGNYEQVIQLCDKAEETWKSLTPEMKTLRSRARAQEHLAEADMTLKEADSLEDLEAARRSCRVAVSVDPTLTETVRKKLAETDQREEEFEQIHSDLQTARAHLRAKEWAQADEIVTRLRQKAPSTVVDQLWLEIRQGWRTDLTARLQSQLANPSPDYVEAFKDVTVLQQEKMALDKKTRELTREVRLRYHRSKAEADEAMRDWEVAVQEWGQVYNLQPLDPEVRARLRQARKNACIAQVRRARRRSSPEEAIQSLKEALEEHLEGDPDLMLLLAGTYIDTHNFDEAARQLEATRFTDVDQRKLRQVEAQLKETREAQAALEKANGLVQAGKYEEAVDILQKQEEKYSPKHPRHQELAERREQIVRDAAPALLEKARRESDTATKMETYSRVQQFDPANEEADWEIEKLKATLPGHIADLINKVRAFDLVGRSLQDALTEADQLSGRLRAFLSLCRYSADPESNRSRLETAQQQMSVKQINAQRLADLLDQARRELARAVKDGRFDGAEQAMREAKSLEATLPEVRELDERIRNTKTARTKLQNELLPGLKTAWAQDDDPASWDRILSLCREIRDIEAQYDFELMDEVADYYDEFLDKKIKEQLPALPALSALEQLTRERIANYKAWQEWFTPGDELYKAATKALKDARDLSGKQPLAQVIEAYDGGLGRFREALVYFASFWPPQPRSQMVKELRGDDSLVIQNPPPAPNNWLAQELQESASKLVVGLDKEARQAEDERTRCQAGRQQFQAKIAEAETYINRAEVKPTRKGIGDAEKRLAEARAIDGLDPDLARLEQRLQGAKRRLK